MADVYSALRMLGVGSDQVARWLERMEGRIRLDTRLISESVQYLTLVSPEYKAQAFRLLGFSPWLKHVREVLSQRGWLSERACAVREVLVCDDTLGWDAGGSFLVLVPAGNGGMSASSLLAVFKADLRFGPTCMAEFYVPTADARRSLFEEAVATQHVVRQKEVVTVKAESVPCESRGESAATSALALELVGVARELDCVQLLARVTSLDYGKQVESSDLALLFRHDVRGFVQRLALGGLNVNEFLALYLSAWRVGALELGYSVDVDKLGQNVTVVRGRGTPAEEVVATLFDVRLRCAGGFWPVEVELTAQGSVRAHSGYLERKHLTPSSCDCGFQAQVQEPQVLSARGFYGPVLTCDGLQDHDGGGCSYGYLGAGEYGLVSHGNGSIGFSCLFAVVALPPGVYGYAGGTVELFVDTALVVRGSVQLVVPEGQVLHAVVGLPGTGGILSALFVAGVEFGSGVGSDLSWCGRVLSGSGELVKVGLEDEPGVVLTRFVDAHVELAGGYCEVAGVD